MPRTQFVDKGAIPGEPATDVRIVLESGLELRERMVEVDTNADAALRPGAAPTARSFVISNALLKDGQVALDGEGRPRLSSKHEIAFTNEALGRLGTKEAVQEAVDDARAIAAARAETEFRGMMLHDTVLAPRASPPAED